MYKSKLYAKFKSLADTKSFIGELVFMLNQDKERVGFEIHLMNFDEEINLVLRHEEKFDNEQIAEITDVFNDFEGKFAELYFNVEIK